jgi:hypothetical protein
MSHLAKHLVAHEHYICYAISIQAGRIEQQAFATFIYLLVTKVRYLS